MLRILAHDWWTSVEQRETVPGLFGDRLGILAHVRGYCISASTMSRLQYVSKCAKDGNWLGILAVLLGGRR